MTRATPLMITCCMGVLSVTTVMLVITTTATTILFMRRRIYGVGAHAYHDVVGANAEVLCTLNRNLLGKDLAYLQQDRLAIDMLMRERLKEVI